MKVLDGDEKKIYNSLMDTITFETIDCWDKPVPEGWKKYQSIKVNLVNYWVEADLFKPALTMLAF